MIELIKLLKKYNKNELLKIITYYNLNNIDNDKSKKNLIKIIDNQLYIDDKGYLYKKDYENRYKLLKGMIINGNDNDDIKNELSLFK
jgi:hypothetical protein